MARRRTTTALVALALGAIAFAGGGLAAGASAAATSLMVEDLGPPGTPIHATALATADRLGARYARLIVAGPWAAAPLAWDAQTAPFVHDVAAHGMRPYLTLGDGAALPPSASAYGSWCGQVATRYDGQDGKPLVLDYGAWNEPNRNRVPATAYRALYVACRAAIRAVLPAASVSFGELEAGGRGACAYLDAVLAPGPLVADRVAIHPYQYATDPATRLPGDACRGIGNLSTWTAALDADARSGWLTSSGGRPPPLIVSEFGYCVGRPDAPPGQPYTPASAVAACPQDAGGAGNVLDEATRAAYLSRAVALAQRAGVGIFDYHGILQRPAGDYLGNAGFLWESGLVRSPSGTPTASVEALRAAIALTNGPWGADGL
jgi:hypothetical protein